MLTILVFLHTTRSPNLSQTTSQNNNQQKEKRTYFAVPADPRVKFKESEKSDKYLDLAGELKKKLWNVEVTVIPIVIGAFETIPEGLGNGLIDIEIRGQLEAVIKIG